MITKRVAILCATGIGDALLMMIAAHQLAQVGHEVTLYHDSHHLVSPLFNTKVSFQVYPHAFFHFCQYDLVILENDNSKRAHLFFDMRNQFADSCVLFHKPSIKLQKERDFLFNQQISVAQNIQQFLLKFLPNPTLDNGLTPIDKVIKKPKQIAIHPSSNDKKRNWSISKFIELAKLLEKQGYNPIFTLSTSEAKLFPEISSNGCKLLTFSDLLSLANFYAESEYFIGNDSGPGHIASNVKVPTLTLSGNPKHIAKWRPGFTEGKVVTLPFALPNFKGINFAVRDNHWQKFISTSRALRCFNKLKREK
ncbi:MAG: glycosyltransferase family 9 protein [Rhabdochlamydiaceae bacterium]|nr:glycosyltransferase family 9 protein [Candidatus Amphrikana amoebophyrae]